VEETEKTTPATINNNKRGGKEFANGKGNTVRNRRKKKMLGRETITTTTKAAKREDGPRAKRDDFPAKKTNSRKANPRRAVKQAEKRRGN